MQFLQGAKGAIRISNLHQYLPNLITQCYSFLMSIFPNSTWAPNNMLNFRIMKLFGQEKKKLPERLQYRRMDRRTDRSKSKEIFQLWSGFKLKLLVNVIPFSRSYEAKAVFYKYLPFQIYIFFLSRQLLSIDYELVVLKYDKTREYDPSKKVLFKCILLRV